MCANAGKYLLLAALLTFGALTATGDTLNGAGGDWETWSAGQLYSSSGQTPGTPYWNNKSGDGAAGNIGWCLTGNGICNMASQPGTLPYYGSTGGGSLPTMYFTSSGELTSTALRVTLTDAIGGPRGIDVFGYYLTNAAGTAVINPMPIFSSSDPSGTSFTLPVLPGGQNFGFYIENVQGQGTPEETDYIFFMNAASNTASRELMPVDGFQHFVIFQQAPEHYFIGTVDGDACQPPYNGINSPCVPADEFDFNDMVVELTTAPLKSSPEPASGALVCGGLVLAAAWVRRRKSRQE